MIRKLALLEEARLKLALNLKHRRALTQEERDAVAEIPRFRRTTSAPRMHRRR